jgi:DNA-binding transcriptional regulator YiaG
MSSSEYSQEVDSSYSSDTERLFVIWKHHYWREISHLYKIIRKKLVIKKDHFAHILYLGADLETFTKWEDLVMARVRTNTRTGNIRLLV